jgi:hypothetical protein
MSSTTTKLTYFSPPEDGARPFTSINENPLTGKHDTNWKPEVWQVEIENLRGKEHNTNLDQSGFQYFKRAAKHKSFQTDEEIVKEYYPESVELIKDLTGASKVVFFDHTIRRRRPGELSDGTMKRQPGECQAQFRQLRFMISVFQCPKSTSIKRRHLLLPEFIATCLPMQILSSNVVSRLSIYGDPSCILLWTGPSHSVIIGVSTRRKTLFLLRWYIQIEKAKRLA